MCRRELQEESSRQQLQFQEQMKLLKVQSEERLQDRLGKLKVTEGEVTYGKWRRLIPMEAFIHLSAIPPILLCRHSIQT